jgi:hypothetical protein
MFQIKIVIRFKDRTPLNIIIFNYIIFNYIHLLFHFILILFILLQFSLFNTNFIFFSAI